MNKMTSLIQRQTFLLVQLANKQVKRDGEIIIMLEKKRYRATHFTMHTQQGQENAPQIIIHHEPAGNGELVIVYGTAEYAQLVESVIVVRYLSLINNYQRQIEFLQSVKHADDAATEAAIMHDSGLVIECVQKVIALGESIIIEQSVEGPGHLYYLVK